MKRKLLKGFFAALTAALLCVSVLADAALPSLFTGDEAWYKDSIAPLKVRDGVFYVPADLFGTLDAVSFTVPAEGNLLFENTETGAYVSVLFRDGSAAVNGEIVEGLGVLRDETTFYVAAAPVCEALGIRTEFLASRDGGVTLRLLSGDSRFTLEELAAVYAEDAEQPGDGRRGEQPFFLFPQEEAGKRFYFLCTSPEDEADYVASEALAACGLDYTVFLWDDADEDAVLRGAARGEYGVATDDPADIAGALTSAAERTAVFTHRRTRLTISTGDEEADGLLRAAGFCPIVPDLTVSSSTDEDEAMAAVTEWMSSRDSAVVFFTDCWKSVRLIPMLAELLAASDEWTAVNFGK